MPARGVGKSWTELFPWLSEMGDRSFRNWMVFDAVAQLGASDPTVDHTWDVADAIIGRMDTERLVDLLPIVDPESWLEAPASGTVDGNPSIGTEWIRAGDLIGQSAHDLGERNGWNRLQVLGVIRDLVLVSLGMPSGRNGRAAAVKLAQDEPGVEVVPTVDGVESIDWGSDREKSSAPMSEKIMAALVTIARWYLSRDEPDLPLLADLPPESVVEVREVQDWVNRLTARDLLDLRVDSLTHQGSDAASRVETEDRIPQILDWIFFDLPERERVGMVRRCLGSSRETLDAVGRDWGVTRERVRQVVAKAEAAVREAVDGERGIVHAFEEVRHRIAPVVSVEELTCEFPWLTAELSSTGGRVSDVLRWWCGDVEISEGWCARPTMRAARDELSSVLSEMANPEGVVSWTDVDAAGEREQLLDRSWIAHCGYRTVGAHLLPPYRSLADESVAILSASGVPMTVGELADLMPRERSARSVSNRLIDDDRLMRVDRDKWALTRWRLEPYEKITSLIDGFLKESGGSAPLSDITRGLTTRYTISEKSVAAYANAFPFVVRKGIVSRGAKAPPTKATARNTPRLYRHNGSWLLRIEVNHEHLRGSGFPAPMALVQIAGLTPGDRREYPSEVGRQAVSWRGPQPTFGSVRALLIARGIGEGEQALIVLGDDGSFDVSPVRAHCDDPLDHALALVGADERSDSEDPWSTLARSVQLPADADRATLAGAFRDRGDEDVAALIETARAAPGSGAGA